MEHNMDAENIYTEFSKKLTKCKGNIDDIIEVVKYYSDKFLIMNYAPISFKFARCISKLGIDEVDPMLYETIVRAHGAVAIKSGDPECNYWFTALVKGSDTDKHGEVIKRSNDEQYNSAFVKRFGKR